MQQNIFQYIVNTLKNSGLLGRLLLINTIIHFLFLVLRIIGHLWKMDDLAETVLYYFAAPGDPSLLMEKPWSVITQMFTHFDLGHYFLNMLVLFFTGAMFVNYFGQMRLVTVYLLGGVFAYLFHVGAYYIFPVFAEQVAPSVIGASGSIMAVFMAVALYRPTMRVYLFAIIPVPIILVALLYLWSDISGIAQPSQGPNQIAHLAHLGGAIFGGLSILGVDKGESFLLPIDRLLTRLLNWKFSFKRKPKMKVYQGGAQTRNMTDEEYNYNKKLRQERLDAILDKVRIKGYEGLTKEEKDFLFHESQRR